MPFVRMDPEAFDEMSDEFGEEFDAASTEPRPSGEFNFERAQGKFDASKIGPCAREVLSAILEQGATRFVVRYDGGYDEGFSYPEAVLFGERREPVKFVAARLANASLTARLREAAKKKSIWGDAGETYAKASDQQVTIYGFDELSHEIATVLLGRGYGTGEYEMYGEFTADLKTGEIVDDESAVRKGDIGETHE